MAYYLKITIQNNSQKDLPGKDKEHFSNALDSCWKHILVFRRDHLQSSPIGDANNPSPIVGGSGDIIFLRAPLI